MSSRTRNLLLALWLSLPRWAVPASRRESLRDIAGSTLKILEDGYYISSSGRRVSLQPMLNEAIAATMLHRDDPPSWPPRSHSRDVRPHVVVSEDCTVGAAYGLYFEEQVSDVAILNFASAVEPGGAFLRGARAQEEDLARCSALVACLRRHPEFYATNRASPCSLFTDQILYSPRVPFFRKPSYQLTERPFCLSVITAPAPDVSRLRIDSPDTQLKLEQTLYRRAFLILEVARVHGHRTLILGAWGCGVFQNDPERVADAFGVWLESQSFTRDFDRIVFAVPAVDERGRLNHQAFRRRFA